MAIINFPSNASTGTIYTFEGRSWIWNGRAWQTKSTFVGYTGSQGDVGFVGSTGYTGSQGDIELGTRKTNIKLISTNYTN